MKDIGRFVKLAVFSLPVFYVFWIIFVGTFSIYELLTGIVAAGLATMGLLVVEFCYPARFSPRLAELFALWRLPAYVVSGTWEILAVSAKDAVGVKRAPSIFRVVPFNAGRENDSHAAARRVLAVTYMTMTPPTIALGVNTSDQKMLFHQMGRGSIPQMIKDLGAQA